MTISVVQDILFNGAWSGSFGTDVTAGNTVFLFACQYNSGGAMSSANPLFSGSSVSGASKLLDGQGGSGGAVYAAIWMLPDLAGGAESVALTNSGGTVDSNVGMIAIEVSGLGAAPVLDSGTSPNPETGNGTSGAVTSGSTGDITSAPEIILAVAVAYGDGLTLPGGAWSGLNSTSDFCAAGWQVVASPGSSYSYSTASDEANGWFAGVAAVKPGSGGTSRTATAALTVTPSFSAARSRGKYRTGALTVTPSFSAARIRGKYRTGSLAVSPSFRAVPAVPTGPAAVFTLGTPYWRWAAEEPYLS